MEINNTEKEFYDICFKDVDKEILFNEKSYKEIFDDKNEKVILDEYYAIFEILNQNKDFLELYKELIIKEKSHYIWFDSTSKTSDFFLELIESKPIFAKNIMIEQLNTTLNMLIHLQECKIKIIQKNIKISETEDKKIKLENYLKDIKDIITKFEKLILDFKNLSFKLNENMLKKSVDNGKNESKMDKKMSKKDLKKIVKSTNKNKTPFVIFSINSKRLFKSKPNKSIRSNRQSRSNTSKLKKSSFRSTRRKNNISVIIE
jgi:hypothetical protein